MGKLGGRRRKRCRECGELFWPDLRVGGRQKTCSASECQRKRQKSNTREWRRSNPSYEHIDQWEARIEKAKLAPVNKKIKDSAEGIPWTVVRKAIGAEATVITQEIVKLVFRRTREEIQTQVADIHSEISILAFGVAREQIANRGPPA